MFNRLIEAQPDLTATDSAGMTALHYACSLGAVEMVEGLLKKGAVASQTCNAGNNALHYAVNMGALCLILNHPEALLLSARLLFLPCWLQLEST
jgi:ankyrin repeat protein